MSAIDALGAVGLAPPTVGGFEPIISARPAQPVDSGFGDILMSGLRAVDTKVDFAEQLVRQFAVDDSIPVHQVTIALEQARLSVELAMQVRTRLVEGYRELMNMQL